MQPNIGREAISERAIAFRWKYIVLPLFVLLLSLVMAAYFFRLLPDEVAYHFSSGSPDRWVSRGAFIVWTVVPQLLFVLLASGIIFGSVKISARLQQAVGISVRLDTLLLTMGNMVALPQLILSFAMLNIFSYNAYKTQIVSLWLFALIVMVLGGILLVISFVQAIKQIQKSPKSKSNQES